MNKSNIVLAIETALAGGSLSLLRNDEEIDCWVGSGFISKSEVVLDEISILLKKNKIDPKDLHTVVVSKDLGSITGQKIGLATARGLCKSLKCAYREVSVLESLLIHKNKNGKILSAFGLNKTEILYQIFFIKPDGDIEKFEEPEKCDLETMKKLLQENTFDNKIFYQSTTEEPLKGNGYAKNFKTSIIVVKDNPAKCIGLHGSAIEAGI